MKDSPVGLQDSPAGLIDELDKTARDHPWCVILYNDDVHAFDLVVYQVQKATGASLQAAFEITLEAQTLGRAVCFRGSLADCERTAQVLKDIQLQVEITHAAA